MTNIGPLTLARGVTSTSTTAITGIGLMAIPRALGSISPIASPTTGPSLELPQRAPITPGWHLSDPTPVAQHLRQHWIAAHPVNRLEEVPVKASSEHCAAVTAYLAEGQRKQAEMTARLLQHRNGY